MRALLVSAWAIAGVLGSPKECFHEPQVRYILADIALGGSVDYYRKWAREEADPDSARAVKEWEAGVRVLDLERFERKDVEGRHGKGKRIVLRGTLRTIEGPDVRLTSDLEVERAAVRRILADLTLGAPDSAYRERGRRVELVG